MLEALKKIRGKRNKQNHPEDGTSVRLESLLALRKPARSIQLSQRHKVRTELSGGYVSTLRGRGMDFDEVRVYQAGDDVRSIDWRVTARTGQAHTKLYHQEKERPVFLAVDLSPNMYFATRVAFKSVIAAKIAALFGWATIDNGDRLGALIFSGAQAKEFRPRSRKQGILPILKILADLNEPMSKVTDPDALTSTLWRLRHVVKPGSTVIIISDFSTLNLEAGRHLTMLAKHNQVMACSISDPIESELPPPGYYPVSNGRDTIMLDTHFQHARLQYHQEFEARQLEIANCFKKKNIPHLHVLTTDDITDKVTEFLGANQSSGRRQTK